EQAARQGLSATFEVADLRLHAEPPGSLAAVVFTYEVFSFLPRSRERIAALRSMAPWLMKGGVIFLSARRLHGAYEAFVLSVLHRAGLGAGREWGDSHTRWIAP